MAGDYARDRLLARKTVTDTDTDTLTDAQPLAPTRVVDVDRDGAHGNGDRPGYTSVAPPIAVTASAVISKPLPDAVTTQRTPVAMIAQR